MILRRMAPRGNLPPRVRPGGHIANCRSDASYESKVNCPGGVATASGCNADAGRSRDSHCRGNGDVQLNTGRGRQLFTEWQWHDETGSFNRWRGMWTPLRRHEFTKPFCKSNKFIRDFQERTTQSFATMLSKFFNNEKEPAQWVPESITLQQKATRVYCQLSFKLCMDTAPSKDSVDDVPLKDAYTIPRSVMLKLHKFASMTETVPHLVLWLRGDMQTFVEILTGKISNLQVNGFVRALVVLGTWKQWQSMPRSAC